jgi:hypothetical protein
MNKALEPLFNSLESQRYQLLDTVRKYPEAFDHKPNTDKWSVHEILAHLISAEKLSVQYIIKKRQGIDTAGNTGLIEELKMLILKISQRLPLKFTAPKPVVAATKTYSNLEELITDWDATRASFKQIIEQTDANQLKKKIYKHLIVGRLNIIHAIKFLREHVNHHLPQINRLLN